MIASRNRFAGPKVGSKKKKTEQHSKPKTVKPKPAWDSYLVPDTAYKLETKKMLAKKQLLVSTHNIFTTETDVAVGSKPRTVLTERNMNVASPDNKSGVKKEKKETDALDLIMSTKDKILDNSPSTKSPPSRGTSSFALPSKTVKSKTPKKESNPVEVEANHQPDDLLDLLDEHNDHEFALPTQLFGKSTAQTNDTVTEVVKDNRQRLISEHTYQLHQSGLLDTDKTFKSKDASSKKSLRAPAQRSASNGRGSTTTAAKMNTSVTSTSPLSHHTPRAAHHLNTSTAQSIASRTEKDYDLIYVADEVRSLFAELKYYEELSGRQSILDTREELDEMLQDEALLHPESHKPVMRYLVQLVCQSMTYLLKSEVDLQEERGRYEALNAKFETLNNLLSDDSAAPGLYELKKNIENGVTSGVNLMSGAEYLAKQATTNSATNSAPSAKVTDSADQGIAYIESDLYPSQFNTPIATRTITTTKSAINNANHSNHTNTAYTRAEAPSPSLKMIAQQYAQDDLYPIPHEADGEHSVHYDYRDYSNEHNEDYDSFDTFEPSFTLSAAKATPYSSLTQGVQGAKVTSTPARLQEKIATLSGQQEQKAMQLAMNAPPMGLSTPVRSVYNSNTSFHNPTSQNAHAMQSNVYTSGGVSSTASTPQVMPYNPSHQAKRDYTALGVFSAAATPDTTGGKNNNDYSPYTLLNSPAPYVDAYASFLPSAPPARLATGTAQSVNESTGTLDPVEASLARVDELIRYSHTIASGNHNTIHTPTSAMLGDEYSTIARLTEYKHDHQSHTNNNSMVDTSMYSVHRMDVDTSMFSLSGADATPARKEVQHPSTVEHHLPMPPAHSGSVATKPAYPPALPIRQPAQASAAHTQLHTTLHNPTPSHVNTNTSVSSAIPGMSGTSASDWLFGAFTTTPTNGSHASTLSIGKNLNTSSSKMSGVVTPVAQYTAPTTTMHTIPTTTTHTTTSNTTVGLVTPTREVVRLHSNHNNNHKTQSPSTEDLYKTTSTSTKTGFISPDLTADRLVEQNYHYHSTTSINSSSTESVSASTPALQAAVPSYLLNQSDNSMKKPSKTTVASGLVQVKGTTPPRHGSPTKGLKTSRIPLKKATTEQGSVYVPHAVTTLPSPQSAPVHPFHRNVTTPTTSDAALQRKLQHLQSEQTDTSHSNASTPTLTLEPWASVQQRVYDARNGSF